MNIRPAQYNNVYTESKPLHENGNVILTCSSECERHLYSWYVQLQQTTAFYTRQKDEERHLQVFSSKLRRSKTNIWVAVFFRVKTIFATMRIFCRNVHAS